MRALLSSLVVSLVVVVAGCNTAAAPCAGCGDGGAVDAATDAPSTSDTPVEPDAGELVDAASVDAGASDAPPSVPDAPSWACDVIAQTGCGSGFVCRLSSVDGRWPSNGAPACLPIGPSDDAMQGETCETRVVDGTIPTDNCAPGLFCHPMECRLYCLPDGPPCPDDRWGSSYRCDTTGLLDPNPAGYGVCIYSAGAMSRK